jgi:hypothetical protein
MKNFIHKIQDLGQKAAQIKQVIEGAPAQAAQLRETVMMTAGQLQQMRADVQTAVGGLRADNEDRLTHALRAINDGADTFLDAGYQLIGVDMEVSPVQRLVVHLAKVESVAESRIHALISANVGHPTISALLTSLAKADALTEKMHLSNLSYRELVVHVGPTPSVRLHWRADDVIESAAPAHSIVRPPPVPVVVATPSPALPTFGQSSYFEPRAVVHPVESKPSEVAAPASAPAVHVPVVKTVKGSDWKQSALDRFKKMPDGSKYRR